MFNQNPRGVLLLDPLVVAVVVVVGVGTDLGSCRSQISRNSREDWC